MLSFKDIRQYSDTFQSTPVSKLWVDIYNDGTWDDSTESLHWQGDIIIDDPLSQKTVKIVCKARDAAGSWSDSVMCIVQCGIEYPNRLIAIPSGTFIREKKMLTISGFDMTETEITQEQYAVIMHKKPTFFEYTPNNPVENITWYDALQFCNELSKRYNLDTVYSLQNYLADRTKNGFRLPTEAEWEYACRAGTSTTYFWGDSADVATITQYAVWHGDVHGAVQLGPNAVRSKIPNQFGLYDMSGNVWEWCNDWYDSLYQSSTENPPGPKIGIYKVVRGCSWNYYQQSCLASSMRGINLPNTKLPTLGFRIVRNKK